MKKITLLTVLGIFFGYLLASYHHIKLFLLVYEHLPEIKDIILDTTSRMTEKWLFGEETPYSNSAPPSYNSYASYNNRKRHRSRYSR